MGIVFINYRRDQTAGEARALYNDLVQRLGAERVFMDVDNIALGRDFREVLHERLQDCEVMLTLIGRGWADARDAAGQRRLEQASDFVRLEIATALQRNVAVTPVLLQDARMPGADLLPEDLKPLAFRNGFEISHQTWESNVRELVARLRLAPARSNAPRSRAPMLAGAAALAVAGAAAAWFVTRQPPAPPPAVAAAEKDVAGAPAPAPVEPAASAALPLAAAPAAPEPKSPEPVPAPAPEPKPASPPAPAPKAVVAPPVQEAPRPAPAPVLAAAAAPALPVEALVDALVSQDAQARQDASAVLQRDYLRSREAVRAAVAYLPYERFHTLRTVAQRAQLLTFLLATEDAAWTPELRAEGARALASVQVQIRAKPGGFRAETVQRVDALAARLGG